MNFPQMNAPDIKLPESVQQATQNIGTTITDARANVANTFTEFSDQAAAGAGASAQYLQSNTIVAKFGFLVLVIIGFLFLMNLGVIILGYFFNPSDNPYIIKGLTTGQTANTFKQDPNLGKTSKLIKLSNNERTGMEFTWSVWIFINELGTDPNKYQFIFNKGDLNFGANNITTINNGPGLYIAPNTGNKTSIRVIMDTTETSGNDYLDIDTIPIRKWVNIIMRLENTILDVYINGTISGRLNLPAVPKQNYNDINVCQGGGFNGSLSDLRYFAHALNIIEINNIVYWGPNLNTSEDGIKSGKQGGFNYLSSLWYSEKL
jgi:hypothetical protein